MNVHETPVQDVLLACGNAKYDDKYVLIFLLVHALSLLEANKLKGGLAREKVSGRV